MKTFQSLLLLAAATYSAHAGTINFSSNSTVADPNQSNSMGNNVVIAKNPAWSDPIAGSQWVSYTNTGDPSSAGYTSPANGTIVSFYQYFFLSATDLAANGVVSLMADDSAATILNGHVIQPEASSAGNTYSTCSDVKPNCTSVTTLALPSQDFVVGQNKLQFDVAQRAGVSFGLDYTGSISTAPEPGTWAMLSGALLVAVGLRKRASVKA